MNVVKAYNSQQNILTLASIGAFNLLSYQESLNFICNNSEFSPEVSTIWDLRSFDFQTFTPKSAYQVRDIRDKMQSRLNAKVAMIVRDKLGYGMIRLLQSISKAEDNTFVCYNLEEANNWIKTGSKRLPISSKLENTNSLIRHKPAKV